jgi:para-aminobenzoate synthetase component 1
MRCLIERIDLLHSPEALFAHLAGEPGIIVLRSSALDRAGGRFSFVLARPFLRFRSIGSRCELSWPGGTDTQYGDPWRLLELLVARYEVLDDIDLPFPLGGCFGYWGYELKNFVEPRLPRKANNDLELPDCVVGFYDSLVVFDHQLGTTWVIATGLDQSGSRDSGRAAGQLKFWLDRLSASSAQQQTPDVPLPGGIPEGTAGLGKTFPLETSASDLPTSRGIVSNVSRSRFIELVRRAQAYIRAGDVYQVNLSHRLSAPCPETGPAFFRSLTDRSPAPFSAYMDAGDFELVSSSPELFLRLSGAQIRTRPIKGTRPRGADPAQDSQFSYQLQTSPKEMAELVMITDLLRNDLGRVCQFGSVHVPELARLERFAQVQHLISTVEGSLRQEVTHLSALAACFPGGSITGAPKIRAMEIIDELEPAARGPYTGALGYVGFNRESQLAMTIRTMLLKDGLAHFQVGAGIVADSDPEAEYAETLAKARGFMETLHACSNSHDRLSQRQIRS